MCALRAILVARFAPQGMQAHSFRAALTAHVLMALPSSPSRTLGARRWCDSRAEGRKPQAAKHFRSRTVMVSVRSVFARHGPVLPRAYSGGSNSLCARAPRQLLRFMFFPSTHAACLLMQFFSRRGSVRAKPKFFWLCYSAHRADDLRCIPACCGFRDGFGSGSTFEKG